MSIKDTYQAYQKGNYVPTNELEQLLETIKASLPFLELDRAFHLAHKEALTDIRIIEGYIYRRNRT